MKKTFAYITLSFLAGLFLIPEAEAKKSSNVPAVVMLFKGDVLIQPSESGKWHKPVLGMAVRAKDQIKTGSDSWVNIAFANGSLLRIAQNSVVEISMLSYNVKKKVMKSEAKIPVLGKVISSFRKLKKNDSSFDVYTPTAVAGVRGTELMVDVPDSETTTVVVFEGKLIVKDLVGEQGMSQNDNEMVLDFIREAVVGSGQVLEYKKGKKLPKAKAMGKKFEQDKAVAKQLKEESVKLSAELSKQGADKKWAKADDLREAALKK